MSRKARWLAEWRNAEGKPVFYHVISRVVDRRFAFGQDEKERFRTLMRLQEKFTGCRVLSYCLMSNHFHLLLEVPPMPGGGLSDEMLLTRLSAIYHEAFVADVAKELADARAAVYAEKSGLERALAAIHERFTYRMQDLGEFMKGLLQRFTQWFNRTHSRTGRLWEDRFKSLIVEDGVAAKTISAYIDLNPVRAGVVQDPADYRWSSYGEAIGGGAKGNGKTARAGLVRACLCEEGAGFDADRWPEVSRVYRRLMGFALGKKPGRSEGQRRSGASVPATLNTAEMLAGRDNETVLKDLETAKMLRCRIRYFTDGAVIGSRNFVDQAFAKSRERFGKNRKSGARRLRGGGAVVNDILWSLRDLRRGII
jgi:putative transposase